MLIDPEVLARFEVRHPLGRGGAGDVHYALDRERGGEVALKLINTSITDPDVIAAEMRGADLQKRLHPFVKEIADVFNFGQLGGFFFISMEYIAGQDLAAEMARGRATEKRAAEIVLQLCRILEKIERIPLPVQDRSGSVIHGDIKPENIRLQEGDRIRLLDFGVARHLSYSKKFTRQVFGSIPYISPEGLQHGIVDRHSDLWAAGVILYQLLAGKLPFPGDTVEVVERRILSGDPPAPLPATCSRDIARVAGKALAFSTSDRYSTVSSFRSDLEAFLSGRPVAAGQSKAGPGALSHATRPTRGQPLETKPANKDVIPKQRREVLYQARSRPISWGPMKRIALWIVLFLALALTWEGTAWRRTKTLTSELSSPLTEEDATVAVRKFKLLQHTSFLRLGLHDLQEKLVQSLQQTTNRVTELPGEELARISGEEWAATRDLLKTSLDLTGNDGKVRSRFLLSKANASRFRIKTLLGSDQVDDASRLFQESSRDLDESARLAPDWFAPHLSKAWLIDEAPTSFDWAPVSGFRSAIKAATERGYRIAPTEQARLYGEDLKTARGLLARATGPGLDSEAVRLLLEAEKLLSEDIQQMTSGESGTPPSVSILLPFTQEIDDVRRALRQRGFGGSWDLGTAEEPPGIP